MSAEGKAGKARELVAALDRRGRLNDLAALCKQRRPNVAWPEKPGFSPLTSDRLVVVLDQFEEVFLRVGGARAASFSSKWPGR